MRKLTGSVCAVTMVLGLVWTQPGADKLLTSSRGLELIAQFEGCRLTAYQCSAGVWTNGIGHTGGVKPNSRVTEQQVAAWLVDDVRQAEQCVLTRLNGSSMPEPVFDTAVSLVINVGCGTATYNRRAGRSTYYARHAITGNWRAVCQELTGFKYVGGKVSPGLVNRRTAEAAYCREGV